MIKQKASYELSDLTFLKIKNQWSAFREESFAFKCFCAYLFVEYFRPQSIYPVLDFLPWARLFLILSLIGIFSDNQSKLVWSKLHTYVILFGTAVHLSFLVAYNVDWSIRYYIVFVQWIIVFFIGTTIVTTRVRFYLLFMIFVLCSFKIAFGSARAWAFRGFSFTDWGLMGPLGYFQNSGELAILMVVLFPIGYYWYLALREDSTRLEKAILILIAICPVLVILGASSRGSQIALVALLIFIFYRKVRNYKYLLILSIFIFGGYSLLPDEQKQRFEEIGTDKTSIQRELYWKNGFEMMKSHPVLGVGYWNFIPYYNDHYPQDILFSNAELPHNIFIQVGTDSGFLGLLFYLLIISYGLFTKNPFSPDDRLLHVTWKALKLGVFGFTIAGQFVTVGYYPFLWISLMFISILKTISSGRSESTHQKK